MSDTATALGEETRRTGKHMRRVDGRKARSDLGVAAPERRRSPEHYARMQEAMKRAKRTDRIVRLMDNTGPLTRAQVTEIQSALGRIVILEMTLDGNTAGSGSEQAVEVAGAA